METGTQIRKIRTSLLSAENQNGDVKSKTLIFTR